MLQPNRHGGESYRYNFQGQETDDEIKGKGNSVSYKYRMHDPRLGRFFATDPLTASYPHYTPYSFSGNEVIHMIELEGLEPISPEERAKYAQEHPVLSGIGRKFEDIEAGIWALGKTETWKMIGSGILTKSASYVLGSGNPDYVNVMEDGGHTLYGMDDYSSWNSEEWAYNATGFFVNLLPEVGVVGYSSRVQRLASKYDGPGKYILSEKEMARRAGNASGKNVVGTNHNTVRPTQDWINPEKVAEYKERILNGEELNSIYTYEVNGNIYIENGHHRYAAYNELGLEPKMVTHGRGGPVGLKDWSSVEPSVPPKEH